MNSIKQFVYISSSTACTDFLDSLSLDPSLSFITLGRSPKLHPVSVQSCCRCVLADQPALAHPYVGVHAPHGHRQNAEKKS